MVSLMPVAAWSSRNQSQKGLRSIMEAVGSRHWGSAAPGAPNRVMPRFKRGTQYPLGHQWNGCRALIERSVATGSPACSGRRPGRDSRSVVVHGTRPAEQGAYSRRLFVRLLEEGRRQDAPFLFGLEELAAAVPVRDGLGDELPPRSVALLKPHGGAPWLGQDGLKRHLEGRPFRIAKPLLEGGVVVKPAYAVALLQRGLSFVLSPEGDDVGAVLFRHIFVVKGTLDATDFLVPELLPALERNLAAHEYIDARGIVARLDDADRFAPFLRHIHRSDHQVDFAPLKELHAVRGDHRLQLEPDAEPVSHILGKIRLEADDVALRIAKTERLIVRLGADHHDAALSDLVEGLRLQRRRGHRKACNSRHCGNENAFQHRLLPSESWFNDPATECYIDTARMSSTRPLRVLGGWRVAPGGFFLRCRVIPTRPLASRAASLPKTGREKEPHLPRTVASHPAVKPLHPLIGLLGSAAVERLVAQLRRDAACMIELAVNPRHDLHPSGAQIALTFISLERGRDVVGRLRNLFGETHRIL